MFTPETVRNQQLGNILWFGFFLHKILYKKKCFSHFQKRIMKMRVRCWLVLGVGTWRSTQRDAPAHRVEHSVCSLHTALQLHCQMLAPLFVDFVIECLPSATATATVWLKNAQKIQWDQTIFVKIAAHAVHKDSYQILHKETVHAQESTSIQCQTWRKKHKWFVVTMSPSYEVNFLAYLIFVVHTQTNKNAFNAYWFTNKFHHGHETLEVISTCEGRKIAVKFFAFSGSLTPGKQKSKGINFYSWVKTFIKPVTCFPEKQIRFVGSLIVLTFRWDVRYLFAAWNPANLGLCNAVVFIQMSLLHGELLVLLQERKGFVAGRKCEHSEWVPFWHICFCEG